MSLTPHALALAEAAGHPLAGESRSVAELAGEVAAELGLPRSTQEEIEIAALLRDVGKAAVMEEVLERPGGLTAHERELVRTHPVRAEAMLTRAGDHFGSVARIVRSCHERWDGGGYPDGLAGEDIPVAARIIFCCAAYHAMTSDRPYSRAVTANRAVAELWAGAGTQFDPEAVGAVVRVLARRRSEAGEERRRLRHEEAVEAARAEVPKTASGGS